MFSHINRLLKNIPDTGEQHRARKIKLCLAYLKITPTEILLWSPCCLGSVTCLGHRCVHSASCSSLRNPLRKPRLQWLRRRKEVELGFIERHLKIYISSTKAPRKRGAQEKGRLAGTRRLGLL